MRRLKVIPRAGASLLFLICLFSLGFTGCGGSVASPSSTTSTDSPSGGGSTDPTPTGNSQGTVLANLHQKGGWTGYALLRSDNYSICDSCSPNGPKATWQMVQGVNSPSLTGNAAQFDIGGQEVFSDILWNNHLIGDLSSQNLKDNKKTLIPTLHNFVYEASFFGSNLSLSQALEFDINQFFGGKSFIWGHECRIAGGHEWDTWNNVQKHWVPSGIPCNPKENEWNHLVIEVQRTDNDQLVFKSITLNGEKHVLNRMDSPTPRKGWYGVTINYQQDGNRDQAAYSIWLDKVNFTYW